MLGKSVFFAATLLGLAAAPVLAQGSGDAGVSGIPRGPANVGGLNNSLSDPSGIGNAAKIAPPPMPSMAPPVVPPASAPISTTAVPRFGPAVTIDRQRMVSRKFRRSRARSRRHKDVDAKFNICRGC